MYNNVKSVHKITFCQPNIVVSKMKLLPFLYKTKMNISAKGN